MQIAELYQMPPGTPVSNLRATIKRANAPKPSTGEYGGHAQTATLADASGEIDVFIFDGPALSQGMAVMLTADAKGGCFTEVREYNGQQKLRLTVKGRVAGRVNILSSGSGQPQQSAYAPQQAAFQPQPQGPPAQAWQPAPQGGWQSQQQPSPPPPAQQQAWTPKAKMTDRQLRRLLLRQFEQIRDAVAESLGTQPSTLESELLGHCMAWATSVAIGVQKGNVEVERPPASPAAALPAPQTGAGPEPWPGQVPGMAQGPAVPTSWDQGGAQPLTSSAIPGDDDDDGIHF